jgi:hypothetical protein
MHPLIYKKIQRLLNNHPLILENKLKISSSTHNKTFKIKKHKLFTFFNNGSAIIKIFPTFYLILTYINLITNLFIISEIICID